jgi:hypothetical protein
MHLGLRPSERRYQVTRLMGFLKDMPLSRRLVLLGDINDWLPFGRPLRWLHVMFGGPPAVRSFPVWLPVLALDRVWASPRGTLPGVSAHRSSLSRARPIICRSRPWCRSPEHRRPDLHIDLAFPAISSASMHERRSVDRAISLARCGRALPRSGPCRRRASIHFVQVVVDAGAGQRDTG